MKIPTNTDPERWITARKTRIRFKGYLKDLGDWNEIDTLHENIINYYENKIQELKDELIGRIMNKEKE